MCGRPEGKQNRDKLKPKTTSSERKDIADDE